MTSGKQARRQRQAQARPPVRSTERRRASPLVLLLALAGFVGIVAAVVLVLVVGGNGSGSGATTGTTLPDANVIAQQLDGIPQRGNVLGRTSAPVTLVEYIDLQCPVCRQFETEVMPTVLQRYVRTGKVKVDARVIAFIGPDSERGRLGAIAAGRQNRLFNFTQLLYFNQGQENSGWLDDSMIASAATSVPRLNVKKLLDERGSSAVAGEAQTFDRQAQADNVSGTPTVLVGKTGGKLTAVAPGVAPSVADIDTAVKTALR